MTLPRVGASAPSPAERDWQDSDYIRIYQSIRDDPKFDTVRDDDRAFAAYVRLLMDADLTYPARTSLPAHLSRYARDVLVKAGILQITGHTYSLSGLRKEREARVLSGAERTKRWRDRRQRDGNVTADVTKRDDTERHASVHPVTPRARGGASASVSVSESSSSTEGGPGETNGRPPKVGLMAVIDYAEQRTGRRWGYSNGSAVLETVEADVADFGVEAVLAAMADVPGKPDNGSLVYSATRRLHPIDTPPKVSKADRETAEAKAALKAAAGPPR